MKNVYFYDINTKKFVEYLQEEFVFLGDVTSFEEFVEVEKFLKENQGREETEHNFLHSYGNFSKIYETASGDVAVTNTAYFDVYYVESEGSIYFSETIKILENYFADSKLLNMNAIFYYICSGYLPAMSTTFYQNIKKVPGGNSAVISKKGKIVLNNYVANSRTEYLRTSDYAKEYARILEKEAEGWHNYAIKNGNQFYVQISGVDSFNSYMALKVSNPCAMHACVHNTQQKYVETFISENSIEKYVELNDYENLQQDSSKIISIYKEAIRPYLKFKINDMLDEFVHDKNGKAIIVTGDLCGLTQSLKAFTSTIEQHSFYGRHIMGVGKRILSSDATIKIISIIEEIFYRKSKSKIFDKYLMSLQVPTYSFDSLIPFVSLKKVEGLGEEETKCYFKILQKMIVEFYQSIGFYAKNLSGEDKCKIYKVFKGQFYVNTLCFNSQNGKYISKAPTVLSFGSTVAMNFANNYKIGFYRDIINSKKIVYDYFNSRSKIKMKELAKISIKKISLKQRFKETILSINGQLPTWVKKTFLFKKVKAKYLKNIVKRKTIGTMCWRSVICEFEIKGFSDVLQDNILKQYFSKIENEIDGKELSEFTPVQERYLNMIIYINERIKNAKQTK